MMVAITLILTLSFWWLFYTHTGGWVIACGVLVLLYLSMH